jgi:hypothetical protein
MRRTSRSTVLLAALIALMASAAWPASAQRRYPPEHRRERRSVRRDAVVFVGGYFYDPFFGPHPWWPRTAYARADYPAFGARAVLRILTAPRNAAVYVDGFYAGIVDDFDGYFQGLPLLPGGHDVALYLPGYRTVMRHVYLAPGAVVRLHQGMAPLAPGEASLPPMMAPPLPPPPDGTALMPRTGIAAQAGVPETVPPPPPPMAVVPGEPAGEAPAGDGTLSLQVQPANANVTIDGQRWTSSDSNRFVIQLAAGAHHVEIVRPGFRSYVADILLQPGRTISLNVSVAPLPE